MDRVEEVFANENNHHKFIEFLGILRIFSENQHSQTGGDLFRVSFLKLFYTFASIQLSFCLFADA